MHKEMEDFLIRLSSINIPLDPPKKFIKFSLILNTNHKKPSFSFLHKNRIFNSHRTKIVTRSKLETMFSYFSFNFFVSIRIFRKASLHVLTSKQSTTEYLMMVQKSLALPVASTEQLFLSILFCVFLPSSSKRWCFA